MADEDGFTLVRGNGRPRKNTQKRSMNGKTLDTGSFEDIQLERFEKKIEELKIKIQRTLLYQSLIEDMPKLDVVVCYGLGKLHIYRTQLQIALISSLLQRFMGEVYSFDPIHTEKEKSIIRTLGFIPLDVDEEGQREIPDSHTCLFYMPHCDRWLYNNVIKKNREDLSRLFILGNSFLEYSKKSKPKEEQDEINKLVELALVSELKYSLSPGSESNLDKNSIYEAFNDLRLISFMKKELKWKC